MGSRDENHSYCSLVCRIHSIQKSVRMKKAMPEKDIFIRYRRDKKPVVSNENGALKVVTLTRYTDAGKHLC
ncbi:hypothetical protein [Desulfobacter curvatus]|uniref:hypothetical protein n=1 Tax=Desulfobacter curvatus TaxID=2290 RepID=UPI00036C8357|nr:hypothetical protein [Desulfobacter curvatus]